MKRTVVSPSALDLPAKLRAYADRMEADKITETSDDHGAAPYGDTPELICRAEAWLPTGRRVEVSITTPYPDEHVTDEEVRERILDAAEAVRQIFREH